MDMRHAAAQDSTPRRCQQRQRQRVGCCAGTDRIYRAALAEDLREAVLQALRQRVGTIGGLRPLVRLRQRVENRLGRPGDVVAAQVDSRDGAGLCPPLSSFRFLLKAAANGLRGAAGDQIAFVEEQVQFGHHPPSLKRCLTQFGGSEVDQQVQHRRQAGGRIPEGADNGCSSRAPDR